MSQPLDLTALPARPAATFKDAWQARLERWYAHPGLYRWSLGNPLTRWLTRRRTRKLFDLMAGFVAQPGAARLVCGWICSAPCTRPRPV